MVVLSHPPWGLSRVTSSQCSCTELLCVVRVTNFLSSEHLFLSTCVVIAAGDRRHRLSDVMLNFASVHSHTQLSHRTLRDLLGMLPVTAPKPTIVQMREVKSRSQTTLPFSTYVTFVFSIGLCTWKAGAVLLEPPLQSILLCLFWRWGLMNYLPGLASQLLSSQFQPLKELGLQV
jgi:hypothetical protein